MRERPIHFNSEMVRAVLEGRKVQTRRIMKVQPESAEFESRFIIDSTKRSEIGKWCWGEPGVFVNSRRSALFSCPFGAVGDRLWVRETWSDVNLEGAPAIAYRADDEVFDLMEDESFLDEDGAFNYQDPRVAKYHFAAWSSDLISGVEGNWRPSIHMPRWASRITLEITDVRVEQLNAISDIEAMREGIQNLTSCSHADFGIPGTVNAQHPIRAFQLLWESIYGAESWQANPFVWVIEFQRVGGDS